MRQHNIPESRRDCLSTGPDTRTSTAVNIFEPGLVPSFLTSEKNVNTLFKSKALVLLPILNFSISVTNALPTTKENMCVSTNMVTN
uniref:Uncharacterized protein n=1 Tax=Rhizophora mucronata TaxID=61149 RepID=A0A2P2MDH5_RHIMU